MLLLTYQSWPFPCVFMLCLLFVLFCFVLLYSGSVLHTGLSVCSFSLSVVHFVPPMLVLGKNYLDKYLLIGTLHMTPF